MTIWAMKNMNFGDVHVQKFDSLAKVTLKFDNSHGQKRTGVALVTHSVIVGDFSNKRALTCLRPAIQSHWK